ncbi:recombinase family protein [Kitasatospora sp. NPDC097605]|uniref:recombinase family protein n=1 Tax=Kitasatospora sp. NPDC097605 TaxID=3157226 RepID=UPI0033332CD8
MIYIRVSVAREEMISPELQEHQCRGLVDREGLMLVRAPLMDLGKSGRGFSDRQIAEIIAMAERGEFEVLVLWVWSRFGRNTLESLKNLDRLTELGIEVRAAKEDFDGRTVIGRFAIRQMLNIAELFSDQLSETWKETIASRRRRGLPHANQGRFGYYRCDTCPPKRRGVALETCRDCRVGVLKVDPVFGPLLADAYERAANGGNLGYLVREWHAAGVVDPVTGLPVSAGRLYDVLDSGFGLGFVRYRLPEQLHKLVPDRAGVPRKKRNRSRRPEEFGLYLPGQHEPVIGDRARCEDVWDRYTARRGKAPKRAAIEDRHEARYSVSGLMGCPHCGVSMQPLLRAKKNRRPPVGGRPHPGDVTWRCRTHAEFGTCPESGYGNLEHVEERIVSWLEQRATPPADLEQRITRARQSVPVAVPVRASPASVLAELDRQEDNLANAVSVGAISIEAARRKQEKITAGRLEAQEKLAEEHRTAAVHKAGQKMSAASFLGVRAEWELASPSQRNRLLRTVVKQVLVRRGRGTPLSEKYEIAPAWVA